VPVEGIGGVHNIDSAIGIGISARNTLRRPGASEQPAESKTYIRDIQTPIAIRIRTLEGAYLVTGITDTISITILLGKIRVDRAIVAAIRDPISILIDGVIMARAGVIRIAHAIIVIVGITGISQAIGVEIGLHGIGKERAIVLPIYDAISVIVRIAGVSE
tara:strand:+ start:189 stop:671 length:483 start_codon:yes stop_codon:yes gene_type:complete